MSVHVLSLAWLFLGGVDGLVLSKQGHSHDMRAWEGQGLSINTTLLRTITTVLELDFCKIGKESKFTQGYKSQYSSRRSDDGGDGGDGGNIDMCA